MNKEGTWLSRVWQRLFSDVGQVFTPELYRRTTGSRSIPGLRNGSVPTRNGSSGPRWKIYTCPSTLRFRNP